MLKNIDSFIAYPQPPPLVIGCSHLRITRKCRRAADWCAESRAPPSFPFCSAATTEELPPFAASHLLVGLSPERINILLHSRFPQFHPITSVFSSMLYFADHLGFIRDVAMTHPPVHLPQLLNVLQARGGQRNIHY